MFSSVIILEGFIPFCHKPKSFSQLSSMLHVCPQILLLMLYVCQQLIRIQKQVTLDQMKGRGNLRPFVFYRVGFSLGKGDN